MQLTIDSSSNRLDDVLRTLGALYGVELTVNKNVVADAPQQPKKSSRRSTARKSARTAVSSKSTKPSTEYSEIRAWAQQNGHAVSDRGRLSQTVVAAFESAQKAA